ncbi:GrpB family protein [Salinicoccus sesuvii]|uniref:GrpB family protein n=1 Tax=Salinicoccus sesuvii TaxID=868281 RepID=A0ABV7N614_9STAP
MNKETNYQKALHCYIQASLNILNHFRSSVKEIHHIGSTSIEHMDLPGEVDVLLLVKDEGDLSKLADHVRGVGYDEVEDFSTGYIEEVVLRHRYDGYDVNFIMMHHKSKRKDEILYCRNRLQGSEKYLERFRQLKAAYQNEHINGDEYQVKKSDLFSSVMNMQGDADVV